MRRIFYIQPALAPSLERVREMNGQKAGDKSAEQVAKHDYASHFYCVNVVTIERHRRPRGASRTTGRWLRNNFPLYGRTVIKIPLAKQSVVHYLYIALDTMSIM
jgi:hypothetical protein